MLAIGAAAIGLVGFGGGSPGPEEVRADLVAAGCELEAVKAQPGQHSLQADGFSDWNTDPPTSGPHFGFDEEGNLGTVIWGAFEEPLSSRAWFTTWSTAASTSSTARTCRTPRWPSSGRSTHKHQRGTLLAPYPKLGDQIALGAWVAEGEEAKGYLAKCPRFDEKAFSSFFGGFQFRGPERFPANSLLPGHN